MSPNSVAAGKESPIRREKTAPFAAPWNAVAGHNRRATSSESDAASAAGDDDDDAEEEEEEVRVDDDDCVEDIADAEQLLAKKRGQVRHSPGSKVKGHRVVWIHNSTYG